MKKAGKIIVRVLLILLAATLLFTLATFIIYSIKTGGEIALLKEKAKKLADNLRSEYYRRPAFIDELNKAGF